MPRQLLPHDVTPEDRAQFALWASIFRSAPDEVAKRGTISGAPVIDRGITLDGVSDYVTYALNDQLGPFDPISFHLVFHPSFAATDGQSHVFFDVHSGGNPHFSAYKDGANFIVVTVGNTTVVASVASGTYATLWNQNGYNVLSAALTTGSNVVWLNGTEISDTATAWTAQDYTTLTLGALFDNTSLFAGRYEFLKIYNVITTEQEHLDVLYPGGN
ncbi:MAG: hypothetical protein ACYTBJ_00115 [Planctomycetota bacterium]|jgi:hypothetical protein